MKKNIKGKKKVSLTKEMVRTLGAVQLTAVTGGCNTTSWTSEVVDISNRNC